MSWKEMGKKAKSHLSDAFELPSDVSLNLPKVIVIGNIKFYVENHRGIIEYTSNRVRLSLGEMELVIEGENLILGNISSDEITIEGVLKKIAYN